MSTANSKPTVQLIRRKELEARPGTSILVLLPCVFASILVNGGIIGLLALFSPPTQAAPLTEKANEATVNADPVEEPKNTDPFLTADVDPAAQEFDTDINYKVERKADVSVPGTVNPDQAVGIHEGDKNLSPTNLPAPGGFGNPGQGGTIEGLMGNAPGIGELGGYGPRGMPLAGSFYGRSGATREIALRDGGGTKASEAAVTLGLRWLIKNQSPDGKWMLDGNFQDKGTANDVAGTAFGLLPFLGAGKTHKKAGKEENPYDKPIEKALLWLIRRQDKKDGNFGGGMYSHGLASIAMCEAYGMTQDPNLRRPAQMAVNYIVKAQHDAGGWRYGPGQAGDTSVVGWQVMALKSAQMAGLDVPEITMRKAQRFLDSVCDTANEGYGYTGPGSTPTLSAVGMLLRVYLQSWGAKNPRMVKGVEMNIKPTQPGGQNIYYYYYATQVMHHFGGEDWKAWNEKMRESLLKSQDKRKGPYEGSWNSAADPHGSAGGRLMVTSLSLCTLEVYYRHLPIYFREAGLKEMAAGK